MLNVSENKFSTFATRKWYVIGSETKGTYLHENPVKFLTASLESILCVYSDAYIRVTESITVEGADNNTPKVTFKNCVPFRKCSTEINDTLIDGAEHINIVMPMYKLIEYSDIYSETSGSFWQFKRAEIERNVDLTVDVQYIPNNSLLSKYK